MTELSRLLIKLMEADIDFEIEKNNGEYYVNIQNVVSIHLMNNGHIKVSFIQ